MVEGRAGGGRSRDGWSVGGVEPSTVTPSKPVIRFRAGVTYVSRLLFSSHVIERVFLPVIRVLSLFKNQHLYWWRTRMKTRNGIYFNF